ncbi:MAG TPA: DUF6516 family protein [Candidatus Binatia bacterium]|jgi:hypothetical protein|nr:DUF6516 family protein [Candidatus Binatia bacterium]
MRSVQEHFDLIAKLVEHSGAESVEIEFDEDQQSGTVDGALYFYDGSRLEFTETVTIERYRPVKLFYVYQYICGEEGVFRYDNAPHHPDLPTFPHHKHLRKERLPAIEPTLSQVLSEVSALLREGTKETPRALGRRRRTKR